LKAIICKHKHSVILGAGKYLTMLYQEIYHIDENNLRTKHNSLLNILLKIILETGNKCKNLLRYFYHFKKELKLLTYLKKGKKIVSSTGLLMQITASKNNFLASWCDYKKMGRFLGHLLSWYTIFKPKTKLQIQAAQVATLLSLLKNDKKEKKEKKEKKGKKGKKEKKRSSSDK